MGVLTELGLRASPKPPKKAPAEEYKVQKHMKKTEEQKLFV
jgi:hypothetical protein